MKIFLYSELGDQSVNILEKLIKTHFPELEMVVYRTVNDLSQGLRQPTEDLGIMIFHVSNNEDLNNILSIRYLLQNIRIILLLPNKAPETLVLAHQLRPRFLANINSDLAEITAVLKKMLNGQ